MSIPSIQERSVAAIEVAAGVLRDERGLHHIGVVERGPGDGVVPDEFQLPFSVDHVAKTEPVETAVARDQRSITLEHADAADPAGVETDTSVGEGLVHVATIANDIRDGLAAAFIRLPKVSAHYTTGLQREVP